MRLRCWPISTPQRRSAPESRLPWAYVCPFQILVYEIIGFIEINVQIVVLMVLGGNVQVVGQLLTGIIKKRSSSHRYDGLD